MGSKARIAKEILPIILKGRLSDQWYVEPFVGGANIIDKVEGNKCLGADSNYYLIEMWKALQDGWVPETYTKEFYTTIKYNQGDYPRHIVGYLGFNCSYSGKWFGGFAGEVKTKIDTTRNYQTEAKAHILKQIAQLKNVKFINSSYLDLEVPANSIIYCDPPYKGTTGYKDKFNHDEFWQWCRQMKENGHNIFISEYKAPDNFECIWEKKVKSSLSANGKSGGNKESVEKLFTLL